MTTYTYDILDNLVGVSLPGGTEIEYVVDGLNQRVAKKVNGVLTKAFLHGSLFLPAAELDGAGAVVSRFVYATRPTVPDYMVKGGSTYALVTDHLGSVRLVVDTSTGGIAQRIDYDAFGNVTRDTNPGFQPFGFAGGLYDPDTGLVRVGFRDYDPEVGRWTAKNPRLFGGGDTNLYAYAYNDPVNYVDPTGLPPGTSDYGVDGSEFRGIEGLMTGDYEYTRRAGDYVGEKLGENPGVGEYVVIILSPIWVPPTFLSTFFIDSILASPFVSIPRNLWDSDENDLESCPIR